MTDNANDKPVSKYQIALTNVSGSPEKGGYLRVDGKMKSGKSIHGTIFDAPANALYKKLASIVPDGESIASMNLIIDIVGRWVDRSPTKGPDGSEKKNGRYFKIHEFDVLDGRALEMARISRDAARALEISQKVVDVEAAYHVLAEFAAKIGRVAFDPSASAYLIKRPVDDMDHALSDDAEIPASDPEEEAARRYDEQDRISGLTGAILDAPELNVEPVDEVSPTLGGPPEVEEVLSERSVDLEVSDDFVLEGSTDDVGNAPEIEAFTLEDDNLLSAEPVVTEEEEPDFSEGDENNNVQEVPEDEQVDVEPEPEASAIEEPAASARPAPTSIPPRPSAPARSAPPPRVPPRPAGPSAPGLRR